jgi:hypothetical protein
MSDSTTLCVCGYKKHKILKWMGCPFVSGQTIKRTKSMPELYVNNWTNHLFSVSLTSLHH